MQNAVIDPTGIVGRSFLNTSRLGPPEANVPAQVMKMAHGGKFVGGRELSTVVTARSEAATGSGRLTRMALLLRALRGTPIACAGSSGGLLSMIAPIYAA